MSKIFPIISDLISPIDRSIMSSIGERSSGVKSDIATLQRLLFSNGEPGGIWFPSLSPTMISGSTFGTGVQTFIDLNGNNNATQASPGSRPAWGRVPKSGKRNLLVNTPFNGTVAGTPGTAPTSWTLIVGTGTIVSHDSSTGKLRVSATNGRHAFSQLTPNQPAGTVYNYSFETTVFASLQLSQIVARSDPGTGVTFQHLVDGVEVAGSTILDPGDYQITYRITTTTNIWTGNVRVGIGPLGNATGDVEIWNPQYEVGSTATTYQKVVSAFDITEADQRDCYYLQSDGVDDGMVTPSIDFTGTDKMTVFAGVRKLSDANRGTLAELSSSWTANDGTFAIEAPSSATLASYRFASKGTVSAGVVDETYTSPITNVLVMQADISENNLDRRINGVGLAAHGGPQGTGNYGNHLMYFFRRGGTSQPANVQCFALIVAGANYSTEVVEQVEAIIAKYTPEVSL